MKPMTNLTKILLFTTLIVATSITVVFAMANLAATAYSRYMRHLDVEIKTSLVTKCMTISQYEFSDNKNYAYFQCLRTFGLEDHYYPIIPNTPEINKI